jgi:hypothetical protein
MAVLSSAHILAAPPTTAAITLTTRLDEAACEATRAASMADDIHSRLFGPEPQEANAGQAGPPQAPSADAAILAISTKLARVLSTLNDIQNRL